MSYNTTTGIISAPVSIEDVREALNLAGSSYKDLGTLCKSTNINLWAKYRPFLANTHYLGRDYYMGLLNGSSSNGPDPNDVFFNEIIGINFYGNSGSSTDYDTRYRYNPTTALFGGNGVSISYDYVKYNRSGKLLWLYAWNLGTPPDPKIYRLTDFNGYCKNAKPKETAFFLDKIYMGGTSDNDFFSIIIDFQSSGGIYKPYCLSFENLFASSAYGDYVENSLGILFTDLQSGQHLLIDTRAQLGYYNKNGFFSNKSGYPDRGGDITIRGTGSVPGAEQDTVYNGVVIRTSDGFFGTDSVVTGTSYFTLIKTDGYRQIDIYPNKIPYKSFFSTYNSSGKFTVQLVMVNGYLGNGGFWQGTFTNGSDPIYYNESIYSLQLAQNAFVKEVGIINSNVPLTKHYYDYYGNEYGS